MDYYLHTLPGLGPLAWQEALAKVRGARKLNRTDHAPVRFVPGRNDIVMLRSRGDAHGLLDLRVSEDVFAVAARGFHIAPEKQGLRQVYAAVSRSTMVGDALAAWTQARQTRRVPATFRVVAREVGAHQFRRREFGQTVADAIKAAWPGRWQQVDEDADIEVWATLLERELLCGVRLSGAAMRQRRGSAQQPEEWQHRPAGLRPALAAAMVMLTEPAPDDVFLDPMAGSGTLLVERAAVGPFRALYGGDNQKEALAALRANTRHISGDVHCEHWDARDLPLPDQSIDAVAVNVPFGKQVDPAANLPALYRAVLAQVQRVLQPGGRLVVLAGDAQMLEAARKQGAPHLRPGPRHKVKLLGQPAVICMFTQPT
jgi:SAM-dependent methyltransferase